MYTARILIAASAAFLRMLAADDSNPQTVSEQPRAVETDRSSENPVSPPESVEPALSASARETADGRTYVLRYKFHKGQQFRFRTRQNATTEAMLSERRKTDVSTVEQRRLFTVQSVRFPGLADLTMQYEYVQMQLQTDDQPPVVFDTRMKSEEVPEMFRLTSDRLRGSAVRYLLMMTGHAAHPTSTNPQSPVFSAESFLMPLPEKPVGVGNTWSHSHIVKVRISRDISRSVDVLQSFRLISVKDGIATISLNSSLPASGLTPSIKAQLIQVAPKGTMTFDIDRGIMTRKSWHFEQMVLNALGDDSMLTSTGEYLDEYVPEGSVAISPPPSSIPASVADSVPGSIR